jgi:hybrid cluster-associated redox disulfide protein
METAMSIDRTCVVEDVMREWPATIRVFLDFRLGCVGCPIATFHTLEDTCREHGIEEAPFLAALRGAVAGTAGLRAGHLAVSSGV